ncbi:hypothetical protein [Aureimonas sp. ME7]|uniref:hypothetical protein n=1 Tax=Aureimonas sp. ME7 TaxID=2744252 RepID=UPI0015F46B2F|nr:hypothetical protein [Aureimonas sp. ME7]
MKKMAIIAAALIGAAGMGTAATAQTTRAGQEKAVRYQHDQQQKVWHEQRVQSGQPLARGTYGAPARSNFGGTEADSSGIEQAPKNLSIPGSGTAIYSYDAKNKAWAYGY